MDTAQIFVTIAGLALIIFTLWFFLGKREEKHNATDNEDLYACPMHPWITSNDPTATCSICGMKLTERE
jgi:LPXTG-motif cell wall-anchored protein